MTTKNVDKIKNVQRIHESMKMYVFRSFSSDFLALLSFEMISYRVIEYFWLTDYLSFPDSVTNLLTFEGIRNEKAELLMRFLAHPFPRVRKSILSEKP